MPDDVHRRATQRPPQEQKPATQKPARGEAESPGWIRVLDDAVEVRVRVVPRSSRDRIAGLIGDRMKLQVTSPPVEGEANRAVLELLARSAGLPVRAATLRAGSSGRSKTVRLSTSEPAQVAKRLEELVAPIR